MVVFALFFSGEGSAQCEYFVWRGGTRCAHWLWVHSGRLVTRKCWCIILFADCAVSIFCSCRFPWLQHQLWERAFQADSWVHRNTGRRAERRLQTFSGAVPRTLIFFLFLWFLTSYNFYFCVQDLFLKGFLALQKHVDGIASIIQVKYLPPSFCLVCIVYFTFSVSTQLFYGDKRKAAADGVRSRWVFPGTLFCFYYLAFSTTQSMSS